MKLCILALFALLAVTACSNSVAPASPDTPCLCDWREEVAQSDTCIQAEIYSWVWAIDSTWDDSIPGCVDSCDAIIDTLFGGEWGCYTLAPNWYARAIPAPMPWL